MLKKIKCNLFSHQQINFHTGLNIVLGDDEAKNSIGKSSALLVSTLQWAEVAYWMMPPE